MPETGTVRPVRINSKATFVSFSQDLIYTSPPCFILFLARLKEAKNINGDRYYKLFVCLFWGFNVQLENFSLIWRHPVNCKL